MTMHCECGFDFDRPSGHPSDVAVCDECDFKAAGALAAHEGGHHSQQTGHAWVLTRNTPDFRPPWPIKI